MKMNKNVPVPEENVPVPEEKDPASRSSRRPGDECPNTATGSLLEERATSPFACPMKWPCPSFDCPMILSGVSKWQSRIARCIRRHL